MLAQVVGSSSAPLGELGPGLAGSTILCFLLLAATLVALRLVARRRQGRTRRAGPLQVVAQLDLSPGQSLYVVRAADRCLLIGGTGGNLNLLTELDPQQVASGDEAGAQASGGAALLLQRLRSRFSGGSPLLTPDPAIAISPPAPSSPRRSDGPSGDAAGLRLETLVPTAAGGPRDVLTRS